MLVIMSHIGNISDLYNHIFHWPIMSFSKTAPLIASSLYMDLLHCTETICSLAHHGDVLIFSQYFSAVMPSQTLNMGARRLWRDDKGCHAHTAVLPSFVLSALGLQASRPIHHSRQHLLVPQTQALCHPDSCFTLGC